MRKLILAATLAAAFAGCSKKADNTQTTANGTVQAKVELPTMTVDQVDQGIAKGDCVAVDANGDATRKKMGVVPGAILLTDSESFNVAELPTDKSKQLVFYCANTSCGASHHAAEKAWTAGYKNVKVMPDGIAGWVKAGKKTQTI